MALHGGQAPQIAAATRPAKEDANDLKAISSLGSVYLQTAPNQRRRASIGRRFVPCAGCPLTMRDLLSTLEQRAIARNPLLATRLRPGLDEARVRRELRRDKVSGALDLLVTIYTWRNGTWLDSELALSKSGFFPGKPFHLLDLEMALGHLDHARQASRKHPELREGISYFPLFWNGSTSWLAVDLNEGRNCRVILAEHAAPACFREVYGSFAEFLAAVLYSLDSGKELALT